MSIKIGIEYQLMSSILMDMIYNVCGLLHTMFPLLNAKHRTSVNFYGYGIYASFYNLCFRY